MKKICSLFLLLFFLWIIIKLFVYQEIETHFTCNEYTENAKNISHMTDLVQLLNVTLKKSGILNSSIDEFNDKETNYHNAIQYIGDDGYEDFYEKTNINFFNIVSTFDKSDGGRLRQIGIYGMRQKILFDAFYEDSDGEYILDTSQIEVVCNRWCVFGWCETREKISS